MIRPRSRIPPAVLRDVVVVLATVALASCARQETGFDAARARAHIQMLAGTIGNRPIGSPPNAEARAYIISELSRLGFAVRTQETDAVDAARGVTAHVVNIIALREGASRDAIALVSHYDSVPEAAGALDDGLGVATCLEAARVLTSSPMRHSLLVLVTDGEEVGLMGARAAVTDPDVAARLRAFLNFDGTGAAGPALLFETGPGLSAPLEAWAGGAVAPDGASFGTEIYKRLPNDTDFTILKGAGAFGVNFAPVGDSYAYHTDRDQAGRVQLATIDQEGGNTVGLMRALDAMELGTRRENATFFDIAGRRAVVYGQTMTMVIAWGACAVAGVVWLLITRQLWRQRGFSGLMLSLLWAALATSAGLAAAIAAVWGLRVARLELTPWYSAPQWFFALVITAGAAGVWLIIRLAAIVPDRARPVRTPIATWWLTLPIWIALTIVLQLTAPTASYLVALPLIVASVLLSIGRLRPGLARVASLAAGIAAAALWAGKMLTLLEFLVPMFGWLPVVMPLWLYPALMLIIAIVVLPPFFATMSGWRIGRGTRRLVSVALTLGLVTAGTLAYRSAAYTADRPLRSTARYVQDDVRHEAWWEVGSNEPGLNVDGTGPAGAAWHRVTDAPPASLRLSSLGWPFVWRTAATSLVATAPADLHASISTLSNDRALLTVQVMPREPLVVRLVLPAGVVPIDSTLAGQAFDGRWGATYIAPPSSGLTVRVTMSRAAAGALSQVVVILTTSGLPDGVGRLRLPVWLPPTHTAWQARSVFVVSIPVAPAGAGSGGTSSTPSLGVGLRGRD